MSAQAATAFAHSSSDTAQALEWFETLIESAHLERIRRQLEFTIVLNHEILHWIDWVLCAGGVSSQIHQRTLMIGYDALCSARYYKLTALCIEGQLVGINNERTWQEIESNGRFSEISKSPENQAIKAEILTKEYISNQLQSLSEKNRVKLIQWRDQEVAMLSAKQLSRATADVRRAPCGVRL